MPEPVSPAAVIVSTRSHKSKAPYDIIDSNIAFINALREEHFLPHELSRDALLSYYVDYYLAEVNNGGFSQFVYNSRWSDEVVSLLRDGLRSIGARRHMALFERGARMVHALGKRKLKQFMSSEYFGDNNPERDSLNAINDDFFELLKVEDLIALNSAWLRARPTLVVLSVKNMEAEIRNRVATQPDRTQRIALARASEPRYMKLIRALCDRAGHTLSHVTAGDPGHLYEGEQTMAWHFITNHGHHYMLDVRGEALMIHGDSKRSIARIETQGDGAA